MGFLTILCGFLSLSCASASATPSQDKPTAYVLGAVDESSVAEAIEYLDEAVKRGDKGVTLNIHSPGGGVWSGFELAKHIETLPIPVTCVVDGYGASIAAFIFESCHVRVMTARSSLMFHSASIGMCSGGEERMRNCAERLRVINEMMIVHVARRMGMPVDEFRPRVTGANEFWLTAAEAKKYHATDRVQ